MQALQFERLKQSSFPGALLSEIPHSNESRVQFQSVQDQWLQGQINSVYRGIKFDLRRLLARRLTSAETAPIYAEVRRVLLHTENRDRHAPSWIKINLDAFRLQPSPLFDREEVSTYVERSIAYKVRLEKHVADGDAFVVEPTE